MFLMHFYLTKLFDPQNTSYNVSYIYARKTRIVLLCCFQRFQSFDVSDDIGIYLHRQIDSTANTLSQKVSIGKQIFFALLNRQSTSCMFSQVTHCTEYVFINEECSQVSTLSYSPNSVVIVRMLVYYKYLRCTGVPN